MWQTGNLNQQRAADKEAALGVLGQVGEPYIPGVSWNGQMIGQQTGTPPGYENADVIPIGAGTINLDDDIPFHDFEAEMRAAMGLDDGAGGGAMPDGGSGNADLDAWLSNFSSPQFDTSGFDQQISDLQGGRGEARDFFDEQTGWLDDLLGRGLSQNESNLSGGLDTLAGIRGRGVDQMEGQRITDFQENINLLGLPDAEDAWNTTYQRESANAAQQEQNQLNRAGEGFQAQTAMGRDPFNVAGFGGARESALQNRLGSVQNARLSADEMRLATLGSNAAQRGLQVGRDQNYNQNLDSAIKDLFATESQGATSLLGQRMAQDANLFGDRGEQQVGLGGNYQGRLSSIDQLLNAALGERGGLVQHGQDMQTQLEGTGLEQLTNLPGLASQLAIQQREGVGNIAAQMQNSATQGYGAELQRALAESGLLMQNDQVLLDLQNAFSNMMAPFSDAEWTDGGLIDFGSDWGNNAGTYGMGG
jgi:hypothetical protein